MAAASRARARRTKSLRQVLPFVPLEARVSAGVRAGLEGRGTPIGPLDTLIAGTALAHSAVLVTRNTREFARVPGLVTENWYVET